MALSFVCFFFFLKEIALFGKELYLQYVLLQGVAWCLSVYQSVAFDSHSVTGQQAAETNTKGS